MKTDSTLFQMATTLGTRFTVLFGTFLASVLTARLLGPEGKGVVTSLLIVPTLVVSLADLGLRQSTAFFIGQKTYGLKPLLSTLLSVWLVSSLLCTGAVAAIYFAAYADRYEPALLLLFLATIPLNLGIQYMRGVMQGRVRIGGINTAELIRIGLHVVLLLLLVGLWKTGVLGAAVTQIAMAAGTLLYLLLASRDLAARFGWDRNIVRALLTKGFAFAVALFVLQLNYRIDIVILEAYAGAYDVGIYSIGTNLAEMIWQIPAAAGMILFSKGANARDGAESVARTTKLIRFLALPLVAGGAVLWALAPFVITLLFGSEYAASSTVVRIILPGVLIFVVVKLLHSDLSGRGFPLFSLNVSIAALALNIAMNFALIPAYGAVGAAVSSAVSYTAAGCLFVILYVRREKLRVRDLLLPSGEDLLEARRLLAGFIARRPKKEMRAG